MDHMLLQPLTFYKKVKKKNEIKRQERERMLQAPQTAMTTDLTKKKKNLLK